MRVLVAGGTKFIGRHLVEFLLSERHQVTLFNRGLTNPGLFPDAEQVSGERSDPPEVLGRREWDWVFDLSCYQPEDAESLVRLVGPRTGRYIFCSTRSVYPWNLTPDPQNEETERYAYIPENLAPGFVSAYGTKKAKAEDLIFGLAPEVGMEATIIRPVLVYGPWDPTDRCHWWLHRVKEGTVVLARDHRGFSHTIYVKDLVRIFLASAKVPTAAGRAYNAAATNRPTLDEWISTAAAVIGKAPRVVEVAKADLEGLGVASLPVNIGPVDRVACTKRVEAELGFTSTPLAQSVSESLEHMAREGRPIKEAIDPPVLARLLG